MAQHSGDRSGSHSGGHHGNTPAAWTAVTIMLVGFLLGSIAVALLNWPLFWIGGVGVIALGAVVGKVMSMLGLGQTVSYRQPEAEARAEARAEEGTPPARSSRG